MNKIIIIIDLAVNILSYFSSCITLKYRLMLMVVKLSIDASTNSTVKKAVIWQIVSPNIQYPPFIAVTSIKNMLQLWSVSATARLAIKIWLLAFSLEELLIIHTMRRFPATPTAIMKVRTKLLNATATTENIACLNSYRSLITLTVLQICLLNRFQFPFSWKHPILSATRCLW